VSYTRHGCTFSKPLYCLYSLFVAFSFFLLQGLTRGHCLGVVTVIHQVAQAGFPEEPPKNEQAVLIHAEFSDSAGPEKAPFPVFPLL
jgi:hypothetical protein